MAMSSTGAALTGACPQSVKLLSFTNAPIQWPAVYVLHMFDTPDEIYVVLRYNVDRHQHLNWGVSSMPQIGAIASGEYAATFWRSSS